MKSKSTQYLNNTINYYKDCYQADNRELKLLNFFGRKVDDVYFFQEREELLNGTFPYIHIDEEYAEEMQTKLLLHGREKNLYYAAFFIVGLGTNMQGKEQKICAPVVLYPAQIIEIDEERYLSVDFKNRIINFSILHKIRDKHLEESDFYTKVVAQLSNEVLDISGALAIEACLKHWCSNIDTHDTILYPDLISEKQVKQAMNINKLKEQKGYRLLTACALGLIEKSKQTLGILHELTELGKAQLYSQPLRRLFLDIPERQRASKRNMFEYTPALLSEAQKKVLHSSYENELTLAIGPPGTGKSFTIANLAIDFFARGKSVLIVARNNQAVDVIAHKIENQLGIQGVVVRGGSKNYLRKLKKQLQNILSGIGVKEVLPRTVSVAIKELRELKVNLKKLEDTFQKALVKELKLSKRIVDFSESGSKIRAKLFQLYFDWKTPTHVLETVIDDVEALLKKRETVLSKVIKLHYQRVVFEVLQKKRKILNQFLSALKASTGNIQKERFEAMDFQAVLQVFPIWLVSATDVSHVLPFTKELFDLAIIDEASQCDIASCLPVIYRAKHLMGAGDPKQLRHVSFLSRAKMDNLREKYALDSLAKYNFRNHSILDLINESINNQDQVIALDEHFRSTPSIIEFSNIHFYNNSLKIMTKKPIEAQRKNVRWLQCFGKRERKGHNEKEVDSIIEKLNKIIQKQKTLASESCSSIGILSPFRDQVDYVLKVLQAKVSTANIKRHQIAVGTAHSFQGDEKDIVFISFVVDDDTHPMAIRHINQDDVFNVSITRAKKLQYICTSIHPNKLSADSLFKKYLEYIREEPPVLNIEPNFYKDVFLNDVVSSLQTWDEELQIFPAYYMADTLVDIAIQYGDKMYGIDLLGYPGEFRDAIHLERYMTFMRVGIKIIPLPYTLWYMNPEACEQRLRKILLGKKALKRYVI